MVHLHENRSDNALEAMIKNLLQRGLKLTSAGAEPTWHFGSYLLQYIVFDALQSLCETYSKGINESIKQGVTAFFAPDDLFGIGNAVLQNLVTFAPLTNPSGKQEADQEQSNFFIRQETTREKINQKVLLSSWRILAALTQVFQHEPNLKQELNRTTNPQIAAKATDFLHQSTMQYNASLFTVLRMSYVPTVVMTLQAMDLSDQHKQDCVEKF